MEGFHGKHPLMHRETEMFSLSRSWDDAAKSRRNPPQPLNDSCIVAMVIAYLQPIGRDRIPRNCKMLSSSTLKYHIWKDAAKVMTGTARVDH